MKTDVGETVRDLVSRMLRLGNPRDKDFRLICYAALADRHNAYIAKNEALLSQEETAVLRDEMLQSLKSIESAYGDNEEQPLYLDTSLGGNSSRKAVGEPGGNAWRKLLLGFVVGASMALFTLWLMQQFGTIYVVTRPESFRDVAALNDSITKSTGVIAGSFVILDEAEAEIESSIASGFFNTHPEAKEKFLGIEGGLPLLFEKIKSRIPFGSTMIFRISPDAKGYKVLIFSELCSAVSLLKPELVDATRRKYGVFCRAYGKWNAYGAAL